MVKFGKSKLKVLNKLAKKQNTPTKNVTNKVLKKKINADKKVSFQKEVLFKQAASDSSGLVKNVSVKEILFNDSKKKIEKQPASSEQQLSKAKNKPVEKQKKRQKTQISDTKMLLNLMKKK